MNFSCNCHSGTALAYQCNLHCCLRTLPRFKHFRSHQSNLCSGQPSMLFPVPCCADLSAKQKPRVLPHLSPSASSPATLAVSANSFQPRAVCRSALCSWSSLPAQGSSWGVWGCGEQGECLSLSVMISLVHTGSYEMVLVMTLHSHIGSLTQNVSHGINCT